MLRTVFRRPSPGTILALLALVVVAAPLADAAQDAVRSSETRATKKKKSKTVDRARYASNAGKLRGYSVGFAALPSRIVLTGRNGKFPAAAIPRGAAGPQGPAGPAGPGAFTRARVQYDTGAAGHEGVASAQANCESAERVAGGGHEVVLPTRTGLASAAEAGVVEVRYSRPVPNDETGPSAISGWQVQVVRISLQADPPPEAKVVQVKAYAVCVK